MGQKVIICKGLPAAGKSTWAREFVRQHTGQWKRINKDDLRAMLDDGHWSKANEKFVLRARDLLLVAALEAGKNVIIDDTNFEPAHERRIRELAHGRAEVEVRTFEVPLDEAIRRDRERPKPVGERVIREMHERWLKPQPQVYEPPAHLPPAIICDLDGTLARLNGRNPYDASRCEHDLLNPSVGDIVRLYAESARAAIVLVSGREARHRPQTERWLEKHGIAWSELHMRPTGDRRKDAIVKREIFEREIRHRFRVLFVLDDRNQVVEMWRELGLTCLQVAPGDF